MDIFDDDFFLMIGKPWVFRVPTDEEVNAKIREYEEQLERERLDFYWPRPTVEMMKAKGLGEPTEDVCGWCQHFATGRNEDAQWWGVNGFCRLLQDSPLSQNWLNCKVNACQKCKMEEFTGRKKWEPSMLYCVNKKENEDEQD